ncbi:MAG: hypothetical protein LBG60_09365, partial [Bifidobacteriaceae bacterium]|nr:hypothetical protein [Bifidobacteriaceae bacterium]
MAKDGNPQRESGLFSAVRGRMALIAAMSLVGAAASVVPMIAIVELARALDPAPGQAVQPGRVWGIAGVAIGALVLSFATVGASLIISHLADNDLQLDLRRRIVEHLRELPLGWFDTRSSGLV